MKSLSLFLFLCFVSSLVVASPNSSNPTPSPVAQPPAISPLNRQLLLAAKKGDMAGVRAALDKGADVNTIGTNGFRPLDYALHVESLKPEFEYNMEEYNAPLTALLASRGADLNLIDADGDTRLNAAVESMYGERAQQLIQLGADVNMANKTGETPLMSAAETGNVPVLDLLLQKGADINVTDKNGNNALHHVALDNQIMKTTHFLVEHGILINAKNKAGQTPIFLTINATMMHSDDIRNYLIFKGARLDFSPSELNVAFRMALDTCDLALFQLLLPLHPDFGQIDDKGATPLMWAVDAVPENGNGVADEAMKGEKLKKQNQTAIVHYLLQHGVSVDAKTKTGETALMRATRGEFAVPVVTLLVDAGANVKFRTADGPTPLLRAVVAEDLPLVQLLVQKGASLNKGYNPGGTPFLLAVDEGNLSIARYLLEHGANIEDRDQRGIGALSIVGSRSNGQDPITQRAEPSGKHVALALYLVSHGANVNARDSRNYTPLMFATSAQVVVAYLNRGANANAINNEGYTALLYRTKEDNVPVVQLLVQHHANVNIQGHDGITPLMFAVSSGDVDLVKLFLAHGANVRKGDKTGLTPMKVARQALQELKVVPYPYNRMQTQFQTIVHLLQSRGAH